MNAPSTLLRPKRPRTAERPRAPTARGEGMRRGSVQNVAETGASAPRKFGGHQVRGRLEMAPQRLEKIESAPENGMVSEASNPQDVVRERAAVRATPADEPCWAASYSAASAPSRKARAGLFEGDGRRRLRGRPAQAAVDAFGRWMYIIAAPSYLHSAG